MTSRTPSWQICFHGLRSRYLRSAQPPPEFLIKPIGFINQLLPSKIHTQILNFWFLVLYRTTSCANCLLYQWQRTFNAAYSKSLTLSVHARILLELIPLFSDRVRIAFHLNFDPAVKLTFWGHLWFGLWASNLFNIARYHCAALRLWTLSLSSHSSTVGVAIKALLLFGPNSQPNF